MFLADQADDKESTGQSTWKLIGEASQVKNVNQ